MGSIAYTELGVSSKDYYNTELTTHITSIGGNTLSTLTPVVSNGSVTLPITLIAKGSYDIIYTSTDLWENVNTITRVLQIIAAPNLTMSLNGVAGITKITIYSGSTTYIELGVISKDYNNTELTTYITSIGGNTLSPHIPVVSNTSVTLPIALTIGSYDIIYRSTDSWTNVNTISRVLQIEVSPFNPFIINTSFPNEYNSTTNSYNTPTTWDTGINNSNILWSSNTDWSLSNPYLIYNPTITPSNNSWIVLEDLSTFVSLSKNFLNSIDIVNNSSWCFIFKLKQEHYSTYKAISINLDGTINIAASYDNIYNSSRSSSELFLSNTSLEWHRSSSAADGKNTFSGNLITPYTTYYNTVDIKFKSSLNFSSGVFLKIYKSDLTTIGIVIYDNNGNMLISYVRSEVAIDNQLPFFITCRDYRFYDGFIYSTSNMPYSTFITHFPSGNTFS